MSPHGTYSRYQNDLCRCIPCTDAATAYAWHRRSLKGELGMHGPRPPRHGTYWWYTKKRCRCDECRAAAARQQMLYRARRKARARD